MVFLWTLFSILADFNNAIVWNSFRSIYTHFTTGITVAFPSFFSSLARSKYLPLRSFSLIFMAGVRSDRKIQYTVSSLGGFFFWFFFCLFFLFFFFLVIIPMSCLLERIKWAISISKSQWILWISFSRMDSSFFMYPLVEWSNHIFCLLPSGSPFPSSCNIILPLYLFATINYHMIYSFIRVTGLSTLQYFRFWL